MALPVANPASSGDQDRRIEQALTEQMGPLRRFLRNRMADPAEIEDILQDAFYELVAAYRLMKPIEHVGAWLFRVVRNRVTDAFRKQRPRNFSDAFPFDDDGLSLEDLLPSPDAGPDAQYLRAILLNEIEDALEELPDEQRDVFIANEVEGRSFKEIAAETGINQNTLLSRKRYAVLHLRRRLQSIYNDYTDSHSGEKK